MTQKHSKYIVAGMFAAIAVFLGWRIIWNWPVNIKGTGPVNELEIRRDSVSVKLNQGATVARVVDLNTLEGINFETSPHEAEESLGSADRWEKEGESSYNEYIRAWGRLRFYEAPEYAEEGGIVGMVNWIEALPNELFADHFFSKHVAKHLDLSQQSQKVYIPVPEERCYMTVYLNGTQVSRIVWLPWQSPGSG